MSGEYWLVEIWERGHGRMLFCAFDLRAGHEYGKSTHKPYSLHQRIFAKEPQP